MSYLITLFHQGKPGHSHYYYNAICFTSVKMFFTQGGENHRLSFSESLGFTESHPQMGTPEANAGKLPDLLEGGGW